MSERTRDVLRLVGSLAVLFAVYVGVAVVVSRQIPAQAVVEGVHVGGMSTVEARTHLARRLASWEKDPVTLVVDGKPRSLRPADAGLHVDLDATLDGATGFSLDPRQVWMRLEGGGDIPLQGRVESATLASVLNDVAREVDRPAEQGAITFDAAGHHVTRGENGRTLDTSATAIAIGEKWPHERRFDAVVAIDRPQVPPEEIDRLATEVAAPAVAEPITLVAGRTRRTVAPATFAPALRMTPIGSTMHLVFDEKAFDDIVRAEFPGLVREPVDAGLRVRGNGLEVVPSRPGATLRADLDAENAASILDRRGERRLAAMAVVAQQPKLTTEQVKAWGISTPLAQAEVASTGGETAANIERAMATLDGALIPPGTRFSLDARLGARTPGNGYVEAGTGGEPPSGMGGGVDYVASAMFEAAFRGGLQVESRTPPPMHLPGTPDGLDAVVTGGDVAFTTGANQALLISATPGRPGRVTLWAATSSQAVVEVGTRTNVVPPGEGIPDSSTPCYPRPGEDGFAVAVTRTLPGAPAETSTVSYQPRAPVTCLVQSTN